jgi:transcriptional regulator with XRE-family HTH domain
MTTKEIFAQRLLGMRETRGLSRQQVADDLHITRAALEFYEKGTRTPNINMISEIAKYFDVSTDYLLGLTDVIPTNIPSVRWLNGKMVYGKSKKEILLESEIAEIEKIENKVISKNTVFEISKRIYDIQKIFEDTILNLKIDNKDDDQVMLDVKQLKDCDLKVKGVLHIMGAEISEIPQSILEEYFSYISRLICSGLRTVYVDAESTNQNEREENTQKYIHLIKKIQDEINSKHIKDKKVGEKNG